MSFWCLRQDKDAPGDGVIDVDGEIVAERGWFTESGTCVAREFVDALKGVRNVTVHINSPGGDVMAGSAIYSALREHRMKGNKVTVIVTALAASSASLIAMAGDTIRMHPAAYMMIHNPFGMFAGNAKELRKAARTLDVISEGLIAAYRERTGKTADELKRLLEAETWMSAATCVEEGFADEMISVPGAVACAGKASMMSARIHGIAEIIDRVNAEDGEEDPEEGDKPEEEETEEPDGADEEAENAEEGEGPEEDPEEGEEPEEDPEEAENAEEDEKSRRDEIARRALIAMHAIG